VNLEPRKRFTFASTNHHSAYGQWQGFSRLYLDQIFFSEFLILGCLRKNQVVSYHCSPTSSSCPSSLCTQSLTAMPTSLFLPLSESRRLRIANLLACNHQFYRSICLTRYLTNDDSLWPWDNSWAILAMSDQRRGCPSYALSVELGNRDGLSGHKHYSAKLWARYEAVVASRNTLSRRLISLRHDIKKPHVMPRETHLRP